MYGIGIKSVFWPKAYGLLLIPSGFLHLEKRASEFYQVV